MYIMPAAYYPFVTRIHPYVTRMYPNVRVCIRELLVVLPCVYPCGVLVKILGSAAVFNSRHPGHLSRE